MNDNPVSGAAAGFIKAVESEGLDIHALLVRQNGETLTEAYAAPFDADTPHRMYSVTKSFTSTAIGLAVSEGLLSVSDKLVDIFPDMTPENVDPNVAEITIRHLLTMSADRPGPVNAAKGRPTHSIADFLGQSLELPPGTRFDYSNHCSYMLSAALQRVTGQMLPDYLRPRVLDPLNIPARFWVQSQDGVANGGWGMHLTARELSRFGQLYLQRGQWEGQQLVPEAWIAEATSKQVESWGPVKAPDWRLGYCYQFWRGRHNSYRMDGLLGQFCIVLNDLDALVVLNSGVANTQRILELVWEKLVPALSGNEGAGTNAAPTFSPKPANGASSPRAADLEKLRFVLLEQITLPTRFFGTSSPISMVSARQNGEQIALTLETSTGTHTLSAAINGWSGGASVVSSGYAEPYKAFASWAEADRLEVELVFTEAGYRLKFAFDLDPVQLNITLPPNPGLDSRTVIGRTYP